jgi:anthranilate synthase component 2
MKPILVVDNYDSFTYNLVHLLESVTDQVIEVRRNDAVEPEEIADFERLVLSPGPGLPQEAGRLMELIRATPSHMPVLGVCLGMQALAVHSGGRLFQLTDVQHGIETDIKILATGDRLGLYEGIPDDVRVGRYHSWMVEKESLPEVWQATSGDTQGRIMSMAHRTNPWQGVQFHPESVMTSFGKQLLQNWLRGETP